MFLIGWLEPKQKHIEVLICWSKNKNRACVHETVLDWIKGKCLFLKCLLISHFNVQRQTYKSSFQHIFSANGLAWNNTSPLYDRVRLNHLTITQEHRQAFTEEWGEQLSQESVQTQQLTSSLRRVDESAAHPRDLTASAYPEAPAGLGPWWGCWSFCSEAFWLCLPSHLQEPDEDLLSNLLRGK